MNPTINEATALAVARLTREELVVNWVGFSPDRAEGEVTVGPFPFVLIGGELKAQGYEEMPKLSVFTPDVIASIKMLWAFGYRIQIAKFRRPDGRFDYYLEAVLRSWKVEGRPYGVILSLRLWDEYFDEGNVEALLKKKEKPTDLPEPVHTFDTAVTIRIKCLTGLQTVYSVHRALEGVLGTDYHYFQLRTDSGEWVIILPSLPSSVDYPTLKAALTALGLSMDVQVQLGSGRYRLP